jgi:CarD family transcriptional regulator
MECGENMVCVNDVVLYGIDGICHVTGVTTRRVSGSPVEYYVLKPVSPENSTIYVPIANEALVARMQRLLSLDETMELIRDIPGEEPFWIEDDLKLRAAYGRIIQGGDRREILRIIKTLYLRGEQLKQAHRKMHSADERLMKEAQKRLYDEFAHVLRIEPGQVLPFIFRMIGESAGQQSTQRN